MYRRDLFYYTVTCDSPKYAIIKPASEEPSPATILQTSGIITGRSLMACPSSYTGSLQMMFLYLARQLPSSVLIFNSLVSFVSFNI